MDRKTDLVNQAEAARIIGVARQSIPGMIARRELDSEAVAGLVFVTRVSAERVAAEREAERANAARAAAAAPSSAA
jgi:hypothetical protein